MDDLHPPVHGKPVELYPGVTVEPIYEYDRKRFVEGLVYLLMRYRARVAEAAQKEQPAA